MDYRCSWLCLALVVSTLASCSKTESSAPPGVQFGTYRDAAGNYRFEAPLGWKPETDEEHANRGVVSVFFRGSERVNGQLVPIDVAVSVTKLPRRPADFASEDEYERFRRSTLLQVDALFGPPSPELQDPIRSLVAKNTKDIELAGLPGKTYHRDYDYVDPQTPDSKPLPISLEEVVLQTSDAYFVLEYRARRDLFQKYHYAADRLKASFQPGRA